MGDDGRGDSDGDRGDGEAGEPESEEPFAERVVDAAVAAEFHTGKREPTRSAAQAHIAIRLVRMSVGATLCLGGLAMTVLPGPGLIVLAIGLGVLAQDIPWAERTLAVVRRRLPADADGKVPRHFVVITVVATVITLGFSVWWTFLR